MTQKSDRQILMETHDSVTRIETLWNGGPGKWQIYQPSSDPVVGQ
jgi:hypothetical protein